MSNKKLVPEYISKFNCIADRCEDTCCQGWFITVDKQMYKKYKKIKNKEWKENFNTTVKRNKLSKNEADYGYIQLDERKSCGFLSDKGLCNIHKELGSEYLCETCKTYPRVLNKLQGHWEESLSTSCPEAARIILFLKDGISFTYSEPTKSKYLSKEISNRNTDNLYIKEYWEIRSLIIEILQNRKIEIEDRIKTIGYFLDYLNNSLQSNKDINTLIKNFKLVINSNEFYSSFIKSDNNEILYKFLMIIQSRFKTVFMSKTFKSYIEDTIRGLELNQAETLKSEQIYEAALFKYNEYLVEKGYTLENYFVNLVFNSLIPNRNNPLEDYSILVSHYLLIKTILVGRFAQNQEVNDQYLVNLIYSIGRSIENFSGMSTLIVEIFSKDSKIYLSDLLKVI